MPFELSASQPVAQEIRRIVREQIAEALELLGTRYDEQPEAAVHSARKLFKRLRALLRLVRAELGAGRYKGEDRVVQQAGRALSEARDAHVLTQTLAKVRKDQVGPLPDGLFDALADAIDRNAASTQLDRTAVTDVVVALVGLQERLADWPLEREGFKLLEDGLLWVYREGRRAMKAAFADPDPEHFHTWRKRVKDLWHQYEVLTPLWPELLAPCATQAHQLADYLGDDHDLAVLYETVAKQIPVDYAAEGAWLLSDIDRRRTELQRLAKPLGIKLYAETPGAFVRRLGAYWRAWQRSEQGLAPSQRTEPALQKLA
ncbi:CHAD domain-containing protein [Gloeobacter violaceus]|uniref:Gll1080 protein n=1 Tax=Gloeobacter violaceus (strain ATCC 29082 / PCC 7421) TaxID=251221 RepID=Q7NLP1_GLOVI|nr:CHAD domain-containing protein [Gloeobacter violaceus]BAC89021.1 gll1080 [Gloeobacter violaceus PCC 7421]